MVTVIGVRFRTAGKIYYFSPGKLEIKNGDHVIVETARGIEYGHVVLGNRDVEDNKVVQPLKAVIRMANKEDIAREEANRKKEKDAFKICQEKIRKHKLEMKLIDVESVSYTHLDVYKRQGLTSGASVENQSHGRVAKSGRDKR